MSNLVYSLGGVIVLELAVFAILYSSTRFAGKQIAFMVAAVVVTLYLPFGILNWQGLDYFAIHVAFYIMIPYVLGIITSHWEARQLEGSAGNQRWFHWGPAVLVVFFLTLATVDAVILTLAEKGMSSRIARLILPEPRSNAAVVSRFPGPVSHDYQEKEKQFNEYLKARAIQDERGWQVKKGWLQKPVVNQLQVFKLKVTDRGGKPITNATVSGQFLRPSDERKDIRFTMNESNPGEYFAELTMPEQGKWSLVAVIEQDDARHEIRAMTEVAAASR